MYEYMVEKKKGKSGKNKIIVGLLLLVIICVICDMRLKIVRYTFESDKVESPVKIALLTDLHGSRYGKGQSTLINAIDREAPDVVLLGGDIFDDNVSYEASEETLKILTAKYDCYYVTGNHEFWSGDIENILAIIGSYGVTILQGEAATIQIKGQPFQICGVDDPDYCVYVTGAPTINAQLRQVEEQRNRESYGILLSHRPEYYDVYKSYGFDLVLCGHAHGGQWRLPGIINGLYAPNQGLFPAYAGGLYEYEGGAMIVSRGLDRAGIKFPRVFNRPELVVIEVR